MQHLSRLVPFYCILFTLSLSIGFSRSQQQSTPGNRVPPPVTARAVEVRALNTVPAQPVLAGIDVLISRNFAPLQGKRVGLITNQTGITRDGRSTVDVFANAPRIRLVALFAPEHGVKGTVAAGRVVKNGRESKYRIPVYSLYGGTKKPTAAMLRGIDTLVFDLQDIGARSYTYISTMGKCMEAAAAKGITFVVLDRPNLIGGHAVEGNLTEPQFRSFIGAYPIAYRHGMTTGELARMINAARWRPARARCKLTIIPMRNYRRDTKAHETGLKWRATSPNIPQLHTPFFYSATGILGELSAFSIGVGTPWPFEVVGAPDINGARLAQELNRRRLPGFNFRPWSWKPSRGAFAGRQCQGVRIELIDENKAQLTRVNFEIIDATRRIAPRKKIFGISRARDRMFDLACGTNRVRSLLIAGRTGKQVWDIWNVGAAKFAAERKKYLLY